MTRRALEVELDGKRCPSHRTSFTTGVRVFIDLYTPSRRGKCTRVARLLTVTI